MVKKKDLKEELGYFKFRLSKRVPIERMILFGGYASGKPHKYSDVDLIIVSSKFSDMEFRHRQIGFYKYWNLDMPFDFLCYTPEEFNKLKKQITIVREAVREGIEI